MYVLYVCMYVYMYVCNVCMYVYIHMNSCMHACIYVRTPVCMYVCAQQQRLTCMQTTYIKRLSESHTKMSPLCVPATRRLAEGPLPKAVSE
jgi:hypothetical protein